MLVAVDPIGGFADPPGFGTEGSTGLYGRMGGGGLGRAAGPWPTHGVRYGGIGGDEPRGRSKTPMGRWLPRRATAGLTPQVLNS